MISYREKLAKIGEPPAGGPLPTFPSGFCTAPASLRQALAAMEHPHPEQWFNANEGKFENHDWTEECQGVAQDGHDWYLSSNKEDAQKIYRFGLDNQVKASLDVGGAGCDHLGDIDVAGGILYAAMEGPARILRIPLPAFSGYTVHELTDNSGSGTAPQAVGKMNCTPRSARQARP